ncbi:phospholipase C, phosphocholine-specific [Acidithiobacillus sp. YTS05]|uniref:Phospholipase C, phosphocholine-specific n=1 Tax=Igneacidithiobacillus copahuensis TaxID=2724909 RepID=A0AAE2YQP3_9PROT|nr:phospholipase C, phosphocholine-specific [Igneacidithiobacillus copahuensis]MBU2788470.1 phospholipase C, phosphocholine-specific [Igneacidithiobacillus copahuensis]MBU2795848.1 phospholipase C, phosphocholine-specific [Acidithiobacillus sp. VAN18-2]UTV79893.1 phospholipase C, phosphocholine-specific [Acidithiobacillus sp. YTS05]
MKRREFLQSLGVGASVTAFLGSTVARAALLPANHRSGSIEDVEHIVVFMQENRSFDHYFGHLSGVRGYNDRFPLTLPGGQPVWFQGRMTDPSRPVLPFHLNTQKTSAQFIQDLDHSWASQHGAVAGGLMNAWPLNKTDMTMGYFLRQDVPFHYALADAFTLCDHYFASINGPTCPNRCMLFTGSIDPEGKNGGPYIDDDTHLWTKGVKPFTWPTYAERLEKAGITWRVYQEGLHEVDHNPMTGNFGENALLYFQPFADASSSSPLYQRAALPGGVAALREDVLQDRLPQVSWITVPAGYSEHPSYPPAYGAIYIARVLDALTSNPKVWGKTVLLLDYDENDGFFDHVPPPQPPTPVRPGKSTISTEGMVHDRINPDWPVLYTPDQLPYGLGPRTPMMAISPWSKGGYVCSEVFDHTSVLRFIEKRFGVSEPNIAPWRLAVCGDLTSAFDFSRPDDRFVSLPSTRNYVATVHHESTLPAPVVPEEQPIAIAPQEAGLRRRRPLAYDTRLRLEATANEVQLRFHNPAPLGVACTAYWDGSSHLPHHYSIGAGDRLEDDMSLPKGQELSLTVVGPDGYLRRIAGEGSSTLEVDAWPEKSGDLYLRLHNRGGEGQRVMVADQAYGLGTREIRLAPGETHEISWPLAQSHHWYDLEIRATRHRWRLAGHVETGEESWSDPANLKPVLV